MMNIKELHKGLDKIGKVLEGAKSELGTAPIIGCTSSGGIITPGGFITSENGFTGIMGIGDPNMAVGVAGAPRGEDPRETARKVAKEAMAKVGTDKAPSYYYMVASPGEEEQYVKGIDTKATFILLKCMPNVIETLNEHTIYQKADYIISNNSTIGELANRLLDRYKHNEIPTDIDIKELKTLITNNLKTEVYKTDEICLQYMFSKSLKSYISSNKKSLQITDIPVLENTNKKSSKPNNELSKLVGLEYIKDEIDKIIKFATFNQQAIKDNPNIPKENLNMCFLGNPRNRKNNSCKTNSKRIL